MANNYYQTLEITDEEKKLPWEEFEKVLKRKYRKLSVKWHPDKHQNDSDADKKAAEEKFKEINEAYSILSDKNKKSNYDNPMGGFRFDMGGNGFGFDPFGGFNPFDMFGGRKNGQQSKRQEVGNSIRIEMPLSLEEIYNGVEKTIRYKRQEPCPKCSGTGLGEGGKMENCAVCGGTGMEYRSPRPGFQEMRTCGACKGQGKKATNLCNECGGSGYHTVDHEVTVTIPRGIDNGAQLVISGEGCLPLTKDGIPGDLFVIVIEKEDERFVRRGDDLLFKFKIPLITAIMGGKINVTTIDGRILNTTIPAGTENDQTIRFTNKGMPVYGKEDRFGSMLGIVEIIIPKELNDEEKRLLLELSQQEHFKPAE